VQKFIYIGAGYTDRRLAAGRSDLDHKMNNDTSQ